jgi:two-component system cell cycle response regulator
MTVAVKDPAPLTETLARVLVSGTDMSQLRELKSRLGACGYATLSAEPGAAALRMVRDAWPDLVVVGADDDGERAIALLEGIKQSGDTRHIPVAMVAGHAGPVFRRACRAAGVDDVILGPLPDAVLKARLTPLFRLATMTAELQRRRDTMKALGLASDGTGAEPTTREPWVLVVSDATNGATGAVVEEALAADCSIFRACDTYSAAEALTNTQFDALVVTPSSDLERALELCAHIRNNPRLFNLPVLLLAERSAVDDIAAPYQRGTSLVLTRPVDQAELRDQILGLVRRQRLRYAVRQGLAATLRPGTVDEETGLYNARFFATHLSALISGASISQKPLSIVLFALANIDWFDRQFGQGAGGRVLRDVTSWIAGLVRAEDFTARTEAHAITVTLPDTTYAEAQVVANRIAGVLLNTDFSVTDGPNADGLRVWVETGTAAVEPGDTVAGLLARARARMG